MGNEISQLDRENVDFLLSENQRLKKINTELLEAAKEALSAIEWSNGDRLMTDEEVSAKKMLKAVIAKAGVAR